MKTIICLTTAVLMAAACGPMRAEEQFDPAARAAVVAPFIDATTYGVMHVDLSRVDAGAYVRLLARIIPEVWLERDEVEREVSRSIETCITAGCKEAYFAINLAQFPPDAPPYVIFPVNEKTDIEALKKLAPVACRGVSSDDLSKRVGNVLVLGDPGMMARLDSFQPQPRPGLEKAFHAAGDTAAQLLIVPPPHVGKVLEGMMPTLPEQIGGGSTEVFTHGIKWVAVGVNLPPDTSIRVVIQSDDAPAAEALRDKLAEILGRVARSKDVMKLLPKLAENNQIFVPEVQGNRLTLVLDENNGKLAALLRAVAVPVAKARVATAKAMSMDNLKQLGLAMHNYHDVNKRFPGPANFDGDGKPLLSWRVHVLPYVEQQKLYEQFHLDEPWDSPHNRKLIAKMPEAFRSPASMLKKEQGRTSYLRPLGETTVCPAGPGIALKDIKDGSSNTIMIVEVDDDRTVIWTKPDDMVVDFDNPADGLGGLFDGAFHVLMCDGSANSFKASMPAEIFGALFTRAGRERIDWDEVPR